MIAESTISADSKILSGVEDVSLDRCSLNDHDELFFDLAGRPVANPVSGQLYIRACGNSAKLIRY